MGASSTQARQAWMAVVAKAALPRLEQQLAMVGPLPDYGFLRSPETGLVMVRGRDGLTQGAFNLGEMTLTRCVVQLAGIEQGVGFGYVARRSHRHAELAAPCDVLLQQPHWHDRIQAHMIHPLQKLPQQQH